MASNDIKVLTATNRYSETVKQLIINFKDCTYQVKYGANCTWTISNSTKKNIDSTIELLKAGGFVEIK